MSYIDDQGIALYLRDALCQIAQLRQRKPISTKRPSTPREAINVPQFLADYCRSVQHGTHLYKREMAYVTLTVRNRLGFVRCVERAFISGLSNTELEENDLQALLELICPDFRQSLTKDFFDLLFEEEEATIVNLLSVMRFRLLFSEFWESSLKAFTRPAIVLPKASELETTKSEPDFETVLTQICGKLRDNQQPSPKIYSVKSVFERKTDLAGNAAEEIHKIIMRELAHDLKVIDLINSIDVF